MRIFRLIVVILVGCLGGFGAAVGGGCSRPVEPCEGGCAQGEVCVENRCRRICPDETFLCGGGCTDPRTDAQNCGGCGKACQEGETCLGGRCQAPCPLHRPERCGERCVNLQTAASDCGGCGVSCGAGQTCQGGSCLCSPGLVACDGRCVDLQSDGSHCGACKAACPADHLCTAGVCVSGACPRPTPSICFGGCVDLKNDRLHCGTCGSSCSPYEICQGSACLCPLGQTSCSQGRCMDLQNDPQNCGACDQRCSQGQVCAEGRCVGSCPAATPALCFGGCVDPSSHPLHCGGCGKACQPGLLCKEGVCCAETKVICEGRCVDLKIDGANCGACGQVCPAGATCQQGVCCLGDCSFASVFGGASFDYGRAMAISAQDELYLAGNFSSRDGRFGTFLANAGSAYAIYLAKADKSGKILWLLVFQGDTGNSNHPYAVAVSSQGSVFVTGRFSGELRLGNLSLRSTTNAAFDLFVLKISATGQVVWAKNLGGAGVEEGYALAVSEREEVTVAGMTSSPSFGGKSLALRGGTDAFLARLDPSGALIWVVSGGGSGADEARGVAVEPDGSAYLAGRIGSPGPVAFGSLNLTASAYSAFLAKISPQGEFLWAQIFPQASAYDLRSFVGSEGKHVCIGGGFRVRLTLGQETVTSRGGENGYLACFDGDGNPRWLRGFGGSRSDGTDYIRALAVDPKGVLHAAGLFNSPTLQVENQSFPLLGTQGAFDIVLLRYDASGRLLLAETVGGSLADSSRAVAGSSQGGSYLFGYSESTDLTFQGKAYPNLGGIDALLLYVGP